MSFRHLTGRELNRATPRQLEQWVTARNIEIPPRADSTTLRQLIYDYQGGHVGPISADDVPSHDVLPGTTPEELRDHEPLPSHVTTPASVVDPGKVVGQAARVDADPENITGPQSHPEVGRQVREGGSDDDGELSGEALDARAKELDIEGRSQMTADEKRAAIAEAESSGSSD